MAFKHKFTYEEKVKIVSEYIDGTYGFREICKRYDINQGSLKDWKRLYETFGWSGLKTGSKTTRYSKETKEIVFAALGQTPEVLNATTLQPTSAYDTWDELTQTWIYDSSLETSEAKLLVDNKVKTLNYKIEQDCKINFIDLSSELGNKIYQQSISFVLLTATKELCPKAQIKIQHSLADALYGKIYLDNPLTDDDVWEIKQRMQEITLKDVLEQYHMKLEGTLLQRL